MLLTLYHNQGSRPRCFGPDDVLCFPYINIWKTSDPLVGQPLATGAYFDQTGLIVGYKQFVY